MLLESQALQIIATKTWNAFDDALDATVKDAQGRAAKHRRTGRWQESIARTGIEDHGEVFTARIGSPLASVMAHELGAWIEGKRQPPAGDPGRPGPALRFQGRDGRWVTIPSPDGVRFRAQPAIIPAIRRQFGGSFKAAFASAGLKARKSRGGFTAKNRYKGRTSSPDFRYGRYRVGG